MHRRASGESAGLMRVSAGISTLALVGSAAFLSACGPMSVPRAEQACLERARLAASPRGTIRAGISSGGPSVGGSLSVSSDFIQGRDPSAIFDSCVMQKSGQPPSRPLYSRADWKG
jgi:hypothetical protein